MALEEIPLLRTSFSHCFPAFEGDEIDKNVLQYNQFFPSAFIKYAEAGAYATRGYNLLVNDATTDIENSLYVSWSYSTDTLALGNYPLILSDSMRSDMSWIADDTSNPSNTRLQSTNNTGLSSTDDVFTTIRDTLSSSGIGYNDGTDDKPFNHVGFLCNPFPPASSSGGSDIDDYTPRNSIVVKGDLRGFSASYNTGVLALSGNGSTYSLPALTGTNTIFGRANAGTTAKQASHSTDTLIKISFGKDGSGTSVGLAVGFESFDGTTEMGSSFKNVWNTTEDGEYIESLKATNPDSEYMIVYTFTSVDTTNTAGPLFPFDTLGSVQSLSASDYYIIPTYDYNVQVNEVQDINHIIPVQFKWHVEYTVNATTGTYTVDDIKIHLTGIGSSQQEISLSNLGPKFGNTLDVIEWVEARLNTTNTNPENLDILVEISSLVPGRKEDYNITDHDITNTLTSIMGNISVNTIAGTDTGTNNSLGFPPFIQTIPLITTGDNVTAPEGTFKQPSAADPSTPNLQILTDSTPTTGSISVSGTGQLKVDFDQNSFPSALDGNNIESINIGICNAFQAQDNSSYIIGGVTGITDFNAGDLTGITFPGISNSSSSAPTHSGISISPNNILSEISTSNVQIEFKEGPISP
jgi:hypothetical protein